MDDHRPGFRLQNQQMYGTPAYEILPQKQNCQSYSKILKLNQINRYH